ncbi:MAG: hypothetical protein EHM78_13025 [Myxococcaceae bacterium]|nr:MAG: hypothetical protein EHM78_13025 [Myxococcaceae bacterium]
MNDLTVSEVGTLLWPQQPPCISIFLPPEARDERGQTAIRWKNLVREARRLVSERYQRREVEQLLAPLVGLVARADGRFIGQGVAAFRSPDVMVEFRVPARLPEIVVVADTFHTRPLVRHLETNKHFFLLALAQNSVTLFEGSPEGLVTLEVEGLPQDVRDIISDNAGRAYLGVHGDMGGTNAPTFHGHGNGKSLATVTRYFRAVDHCIRQFLRGEHAPLILAGVVEHHRTIGRSVATRISWRTESKATSSAWIYENSTGVRWRSSRTMREKWKGHCSRGSRGLSSLGEPVSA